MCLALNGPWLDRIGGSLGVWFPSLGQQDVSVAVAKQGNLASHGKATPMPHQGNNGGCFPPTLVIKCIYRHSTTPSRAVNISQHSTPSPLLYSAFSRTLFVQRSIFTHIYPLGLIQKMNCASFRSLTSPRLGFRCLWGFCRIMYLPHEIVAVCSVTHPVSFAPRADFTAV